jgi:hypothetical protein
MNEPQGDTIMDLNSLLYRRASESGQQENTCGMARKKTAWGLAALLAAAIAGCATPDDYKHAFDESRALRQNTHAVALPFAQTRQAVVSTFIKDGFNISQAQPDLVTATRTIRDSKDEELSYVVSATAAIAPNDDAHTQVSLSANQQTVLHRATHDWFHLLWVVPLFPYATEYQTVVRSESTVEDHKVYGSFFSDLDKAAVSLKAANAAAVPDAPAATNVPAPASGVPVPAAAQAATSPLGPARGRPAINDSAGAK